MSRRVGGDDVEITRTTQRGVYAGAWQAYLGDRVPQIYTTRCGSPSRPGSSCWTPTCSAVMREWFPMALHLLEGLFCGMQNTRQVTGQRERLLALGSLSAGLTHELNNPAAAAVRATSTLRDRVAGMRHKLGAIAAGPWDRLTMEELVKLQENAVEQVAKAPALSPMEASDREESLGEWFEDHAIRGGWDIAPTFVQAGLDVDWLDRWRPSSGRQVLEGAVRWLNYTVETELLMNEIEDSTTRDFDAGRSREAVLAAGPGAVPVRRRARAAGQHPADAGPQDRRRHHRGEGLRPQRCPRSRRTRPSSTRCGRT